MSKVTISVEEGGSHGARATRVASTTGQEFESEEIAAGEERSFELGEEERLVVQAGQPTAAQDAEAEKSDKRAKKS